MMTGQTTKKSAEMMTRQTKQKRDKNKSIPFPLFYILFAGFSFFGYSDQPLSPPETPLTRTAENSLSPTAPPQQTASPRSHSQNAVWRIQNSFSSGTAFFIGPNLLVTNFHILQSLLKHDNSLKNIVLQKEGSFDLKIRRALAVSALDDLAIIEAKANVSNYLNIEEDGALMDETLLAFGYPHGQFKKITNTGELMEEGSHYTFFANHSALKGASGSPVLNTKGQVAGVLFAAGHNLLHAVKANRLKDLIAGEAGQICPPSISAIECVKTELNRLQQSTRSFSAFAQFRLALIYLSKSALTERDIQISKRWMTESAEQGYAPAQYNLALMYDNKDEGTREDSRLAFYWMTESAEQGYAPAQHDLALIYDNEDEGTREDSRLAFHWMTESADQSYAPAQHDLALMYISGDGAPKDSQIAFLWMIESAEQGYAPAQHDLALMYISGDGAPKDSQMAFHWMTKPAEQGHAPAQHALALMYLESDGEPENSQIALDWMTESAEQGYAPAQYDLALMYLEGDGAPKDSQTAIDWMTESAEQGYALALYDLAVLYEKQIAIQQKPLTLE